ncbi:hypothetical protein ACFTSD_25875 [Nocardiaceae bacterium NPDC056970]
MTRQLRRAFGVGVGAGIVVLAAAGPAAAAPCDTVFPIPLAGVGISAPGLPTAGAGYLIAGTDTEMPGVTRFRPAGIYCCVVIHWRNLSTGMADTVYLGYPSVDAYTGSGVVVATVTPPPVTPGYVPLAILPGAGIWTVP